MVSDAKTLRHDAMLAKAAGTVIALTPDTVLSLFDDAREHQRLLRALRDYAGLAPLDLKSCHQIQRDLFAIAGRRHTHVAPIGPDLDPCAICGRDIRDSVHSSAAPKENHDGN